MDISSKYLPLFKLLHNESEEVDIAIVTGGRFSGKSWGVGMFSAEAFIQYDWRTLYTRFTNVSTQDSIIPEFKSKLDLLGYDHCAKITRNRVESLVGEGLVSFKGMKTGASNQTANLKSLSGFNCLIVDEAEEIPDYETFERVYFSICSNEKRNLCVLILNPASKEHWIFQELFEKRGVPEGHNGIVDNILYIHTSYLDVDPSVIPDNILKEYERMKIEDPEKYRHIILGGWLENPEGVVYPKRQLNWFDEEDFDPKKVEGVASYIDIADQGNDYLCMPVGQIIGKEVFITDVVYSQEEEDVTMPMVVDMINRFGIQYVRVESNNQGYGYARRLREEDHEASIMTIVSKSNKHTRIIMEAGFVLRHFRFKRQYDPNSPYGKFIKHLTHYMKDDSLNKSVVKDAIDATSGLSRWTRSTLGHLFDYSQQIEGEAALSDRHQ